MMDYTKYSKDELIVMLKRSEYLVDKYMATVSILHCLPELSYREIDDLITEEEN